MVFSFVIIACAVLAVFGLIGRPANTTEQDPGRGPYEHVMRITAVLEFDGERIEVDDLIDCRSDYSGPASRAVQLPFNISRAELAYGTKDGGLIKIDIPPKLCSAYSEVWAGIDKGYVVPEAWIPIIGWFDNRDPNKATIGERYWSETALKNPNGRLKVIKGFKVLVPEQTDALIGEAEEQAIVRDLWLGAERHTTRRDLGVRSLPSYIRIPREEWSQPPEYLRNPDRPADPSGLRNLLDSLPHGEGLMFLGDDINGENNEAISFSINDLITGRWGRANSIGYHGIPQRNEPRWGMYLSQRSWERAQTQKERIPFYDDWVPLEYDKGELVLRTDRPGLRYHYRGYGDWYRETDRSINFLGKPFFNGPYEVLKGSLIFDLETRDLWVRT
ncbi:hypothetical protein DS906_05090 [Ruegeria sp. A3M17]|nr:hypothetical protein DS906_05090 [Ruegeria sp. A3M17]